MLLPWSKPTSILIAPEGLALCHAQSTITQPLSHHASPTTWETLLQELTNIAPQLALKQVRFVISSYFVRYTVLSWQPGIYSQQDWQGLAEHHFRKTFGNASESWQVQVSLQGFEENIVACAIDRALIMQLENLSKQLGFRLNSIEPALAAVTRPSTQTLQHSDLFLLAEPHHILLAELTSGTWKQFSVTTPPTEHMREELNNVLTRAMHTKKHQGALRLAYFGAPEHLTQQPGLQALHLANNYKNHTSILVIQ